MVNKKTLLWVLMMLAPSYAFALFERTGQDLRAFEDRLRYEFIERETNLTTITPILLATPQAYWQESAADFPSAVTQSLSKVFSQPGDLISCAECFQNRIFVSRDNRMVVQSGDLSLTDLARLRQVPGFAQSRSLMVVSETPSGISFRVTNVSDGKILYSGIADSTQDLSKVERPLRLAQEMDRRERGESLSYFHFDLGVYPDALVHLKWLEQWGSRNQHLSGLAISAYNPTGAIGVTYLYMLPKYRYATVGFSGFYSLQGVFASAEDSIGDSITLQTSINYAFSGAYGIFVSADTDGKITAGLSLMNPVLLPFLF